MEKVEMDRMWNGMDGMWNGMNRKGWKGLKWLEYGMEGRGMKWNRVSGLASCWMCQSFDLANPG